MINRKLKEQIKKRFNVALRNGGAEYLDAIEISKRIYSRTINHRELKKVIDVLEEIGYHEIKINGDFKYSIYDNKAHYECGCSWEHCCI